MFDLKKELKKLELMIEYVNKTSLNLGIAEQKRLGKLDWTINTEYFNYLLYVSGIYANFDGVRGVSFNVRSKLYKRFDSRVEYITLLDPYEDDEINPDFNWYETKCDIDNCTAIQRLKVTIRSMVKNPNGYWRATNC